MPYLNEEEARSKHPEAFALLDRENALQAPDAKFLCAADGHMGDEDIADLVVLFRTEESSERLLCAWVANVDDDPYIDEFGEEPVADAFGTLSSVTDDELPQTLQTLRNG